MQEDAFLSSKLLRKKFNRDFIVIEENSLPIIKKYLSRLNQTFLEFDRILSIDLKSELELEEERNQIRNQILLLASQIEENLSKNAFIGQPFEKEITSILFLAANPSDEGKLQTEREYTIIEQRLNEADFRDKFKLLHPKLNLTIQEFIRAIE